MKLSWPAAVLLALLPGFVLSQSLGEIAEQERAKRKKTGAKSYTNDDLSKATPTPSPSPSPSATPAPATPAARSKDRFKVTPSAPAGETAPPRKPSEVETPSGKSSDPEPASRSQGGPPKDEMYWRGQLQARQDAVSAAERQVAEVQKKLDGVRQGQIQPLPIDAMTQQPPIPSVQGEDYAKLQKELADANAALDAARKSLADLEEEARRAGVPPGWVR